MDRAQSSESTFLAPDNARNILDTKQSFEVAHVFNVSRVSNSSLWTAVEKLRFQETEALLLDPNSAGPAFETELERLFQAAGRLNTYRPTWCARWSQFKKYIRPSDPRSWNSAVGVVRKWNSLQIIVRYSARGLNSCAPPSWI